MSVWEPSCNVPRVVLQTFRYGYMFHVLTSGIELSRCLNVALGGCSVGLSLGPKTTGTRTREMTGSGHKLVSKKCERAPSRKHPRTECSCDLGWRMITWQRDNYGFPVCYQICRGSVPREQQSNLTYDA